MYPEFHPILLIGWATEAPEDSFRKDNYLCYEHTWKFTNGSYIQRIILAINTQYSFAKQNRFLDQTKALNIPQSSEALSTHRLLPKIIENIG